MRSSVALRSWIRGADRGASCATCCWRRGRPSRPFFALFLTYNRLTTGDWLLQPFQLYDAEDSLGFHRNPQTLAARFDQNVTSRLWLLVRWCPAVLLAAVGPLLCERDHRRRARWLLFALPVALLVAHFLYWGRGGNQYGPRYLYEAMFALLILAALALERLRGAGPLALALALLLGGRGPCNCTRGWATRCARG